MKLNGIALCLCLAAGMLPAHSYAQHPDATAENVPAVTVTAADNASQEVRVQNAEGRQLEVYNLIGVRVAVFRIESADKTVTLGLQRGCYILKLGKVARKVFLR